MSETDKIEVPKPVPKRLTAAQRKFLKILEAVKDLDQAKIDAKLKSEKLDYWLKHYSKFRARFYPALGISEKQKDFLDSYERLYHVKNSCKAVRITRRTFERWNKDNEVFARMFRDIEEGHKDDIEGMMRVRIKEKSDKILVHYSQANLKDRGYGKQEEVTHKGGLAVNVYSKLSDEELQNKIAELKAEKNSNNE